MPAIDFRKVRQAVSMADVLGLLGFEAARSAGSPVRGPCPLHGEEGGNRVFSANLIQHALRWFKCGAAGNQLDLWAKATKKPLHEAALELCARLHREVPWLHKRTEKRNP
ncbi:MAG: CHC2 zinc finger domain-containing protein [Gemmataceae bacterium]